MFLLVNANFLNDIQIKAEPLAWDSVIFVTIVFTTKLQKKKKRNSFYWTAHALWLKWVTFWKTNPQCLFIGTADTWFGLFQLLADTNNLEYHLDGWAELFLW